MALLTVIFLLFGLVFAGLGTGSGSTSTTVLIPATKPHHGVKCSARMKAQSSAGKSRRDCGGPPANP